MSPVRHLPRIAKGEIRLYAVAADGGVIEQPDGADPETISFHVEDGELCVELDTTRAFRHGLIEGSENWIVLTYDAADDTTIGSFLTSIFDNLAEKEQIKRDMESMYSSSLALLEEVSMVGEMLPNLATGDTELDVVRMGLESLIVAASVESAIFVRYDAERELAEVLLHVEAATGVVADYEGDRFITAGVAWDAISSTGGALLEKVPTGSALGESGSPERHAKREIIAVPVRYGGAEKSVTLGAMLVLDKRANAYSTTDEFGSQDTKLATSVAAMLGSVLGTRKVAELGNEMRTAQTLHQQILPERSPTFEGFDLAGRSVSPGAVGGDYYDFLPLPDGRVMCVVADVSGHNLASCLVMVGARAALRLLATTTTNTGEVFDKLAASLFPDLSRTELFITAVIAMIDSETRTLEMANAGHNPTMICRAATGEVEEVFAEDTVIGFLPAPKHDVATRSLESGDVVLLYTDGVTEAANSEGGFLGEERLRDILKGAAHGTAGEILDSVYSAVDEWADEAAEGDDISVVVIKVN